MTQTTPLLSQLAYNLTKDASTERERAVIIHDYVRDSIRYGFTPRFDDASPEQTLDVSVGHCNPQTRLFVEMLRAVGVEAKMHFVTIPGEILRGVMPNPPALISHGFADVRIGGRWLKVDSYIVTPEHAAGAAMKLEAEGRVVGYGFHIKGKTTWDGRSDSFSQFADPSMMIEDQGSWDSAEEFFSSKGYRHRLGPVSFSTMMSAMPAVFFKAFSALVDGSINALAANATPTHEALFEAA